MKNALLAALILIPSLAQGGGEKIKWMKYDQALQAAQATGKPICIFSTCANATGAESGKGACPT